VVQDNGVVWNCSSSVDTAGLKKSHLIPSIWSEIDSLPSVFLQKLLTVVQTLRYNNKALQCNCLHHKVLCWAMADSNCRLLPCEGELLDVTASSLFIPIGDKYISGKEIIQSHLLRTMMVSY
jgi:hypothetical protein